MRGEVDGLAIELQEFLARKNLRIETFQLQIGQVTVLPKLAMKGTIQLLQPSTGELTLTLLEKQLSDFLSLQFVGERSQPSASANPTQNYRLHQIHAAFLPENQLQLHLDWTAASIEAVQSSTLLTTPEIASEGQIVNLAVQSTSGEDVPAELTTAILSPINEILSLQDFKQRGTSFQIQQIETMPEKLTLHASATIDQFPTR
nr:LmeA family phospholipid-binding protein [Leptolyngbya sp. FACHB-8]